MPHSTISIILIEPQMGENIGAAARAMANFNLRDLRIISPRDGWPNQAAIDMGSGAFDHIHPQIFESFEETIADLNFVLATTARPRDMIKPVFTPSQAAQNCLQRSTQGQKIGLVFGRERNGLENDEIARCQGIVTVPTNPDFSSLNLGQSVLLMAYALSQVNEQTDIQNLAHGDSFPVTQDKLEEFQARLDDELDKHGFYKTKDIKPTMQRNIRNIFTRSDLSDQEVRTLHGVISSLIGKKLTAK